MQPSVDDDTKDISDDECAPVTLYDMSVSHFLYADDLVLVSKSEDGLQKSLDNLHIFANSKHLAVSVKKSKTVIFNKGGKLIDSRYSTN